MVAHLVRLHLKLTAGALRQSVSRTIGYVVLWLYAAGFAVFGFLGLISLRAVGGRDAAALTVPAFTAVSLFWSVATLLIYGMDQTLNPARFALLPLRARDLLPGMTVAGLLLGAGGIIGTLWTVGYIIAWSTSVPALLAALVAGPVGLLSALWLSRVLAALFSALLERRRTRELAGIVLFLALMGVAVGFQGLSRSLAGELVEAGEATIWMPNTTQLAEVLGWTPLGWAWAIPASVASGQWISAAIRLVLAVAWAALLWKGWEKYLDRALVSPLTSASGGGTVRTGGWVDRLFPATPTGAVAARSLRYWRRDSRHTMSVIGVLLMPVFIMFPLTINGLDVPASALIFVPCLTVVMAGSIMATETTYDGSALWLHAASGISGREDRAGRALSLLVLLVPVWLVSIIVVTIWFGPTVQLVASLGVGLALLGGGIGVGAVTSGFWNQATAPPGSNPFSNNNKGGLAGFVSFALTFLGTSIVILPTVVFALLGFWFGWATWVALLMGAATGVLAGWFGLRWGGAILDRRWPEVLKQVTYEAV